MKSVCLRRKRSFRSEEDIIRKDVRSQGVFDWWLVLDDFGLRDLGWESVRFNSRSETMIDRQVELYERAPRQVAYDGAFSSKANLEAIKGKGVEDVAFTKAHFAVTDMVKSSWVYQRLRRFRCGIEGVISFLKRVFGLDRCTWRSLPSFKSYVWSSIITCNLLVMARHLLR